MFRFTIRDMLWLTVVAALAVGWWIDHRGAPRDRDRSLVRLKFAEAEIDLLKAATPSHR
jgi:hypothetical protein